MSSSPCRKLPQEERSHANPANGQHLAEPLEELFRRHLLVGEEGVASYCESGRGYYEPEFAVEERDRFSICIVRTQGDTYQIGDHDRPFALQSISKVFVYGLALADHGRDYVLEHVGVEPSGDTFNSIVFDERNNRPHNPMVSAGTLVTTDLVRGKDLEDVFEDEMRTVDRNRLTAYLMRSNGMISGDVESILASTCGSAQCRSPAVISR